MRENVYWKYDFFKKKNFIFNIEISFFKFSIPFPDEVLIFLDGIYSANFERAISHCFTVVHNASGSVIKFDCKYLLPRMLSKEQLVKNSNRIPNNFRQWKNILEGVRNKISTRHLCRLFPSIWCDDPTPASKSFSFLSSQWNRA